MPNLSISRARFLVTFLNSGVKIRKIEDNAYVLAEHCDTMSELMLIALSDMGARMDENPDPDDENAKIIQQAKDQLADHSLKKHILGVIRNHRHGLTCAELGRFSRKYRALNSRDQARIIGELEDDKAIVNITIPPRSGCGKPRKAYFAGTVSGSHGA